MEPITTTRVAHVLPRRLQRRFRTSAHPGTRVMSRYEYVRDPETIYRLSSTLVAEAADVSALPPELATLAYRLVHACGMPDIVGDLRWHGTPVEAAGRALRAGACVLVDCEMVADGVIRGRLPAANTVLCCLNDPRTRAIQRARPDHPLRRRGRAVAGTTARIGHRHRQRADRALSASGDAGRRARAATGGDSRLSGRLRGRGRIEARAGGSRTRHSFRHPVRPPGRKRHGRGGGEFALTGPLAR